jgi:hypothetical protein
MASRLSCHQAQFGAQDGRLSAPDQVNPKRHTSIMLAFLPAHAPVP